MSEKKVICKYKFPESYNPLYANGAHGGITPQGEVSINFYLERHAIPKSQTFNVEDGKMTNEILEEVNPPDFNSSFIRYVQTGVILDYKTAKAIHVWLGNHLKSLENIEKQTK